MKPSYFVIPCIKREKYETPEKVIETVCRHYGLSREEITSPSRKWDIVFPRQLCMYLLRKKFDMPLTKIGKCFKRDHTTVMFGLKSIENYLQTNAEGKRDEILYFYPQYC